MGTNDAFERYKEKAAREEDERVQRAMEENARIAKTVRMWTKRGVFATLGLITLITIFSGFYIVQPGERGIVVTWGHMSEAFSREGLGFKIPWISRLETLSIKQQTAPLNAQTFSSDLQQVGIHLKVLYRIPEASVLNIYQNYAGDPMESLISPRVQEACKEVTALHTAEQIAKDRETIKQKTLEIAKKKVGDMLFIEDIVVENIDLSKELETAIEQKMVQQQEAAKATFTKQKAEMDAQTAVVRAEGEAKSMAARANGEAAAIKVRGEALRLNPNVIEFMIAEKWNGITPLVVGGGSGTNVLLPVSKAEAK